MKCKTRRARKEKAMYDVLEGRSIRLRKARESDYESMLHYVWSDPDVYQWMLYQPTLTKEEALARCRRSIAYQKEHFNYFVALRETDEAIGLCGVQEWEPGRYEESGICIGTAFQGRGYGKEILSLLLDLSFRGLDAKDFLYSYFPENQRSKRLAEGFGFHFDLVYELVRPWDGAVKTIEACLLERDEYFRREQSLRMALGALDLHA